MTATPPRFYFDYVDPLSFLLEREIQAVEAEGGVDVERIPLELAPPPRAMMDPDGPAWRSRVDEARRLAEASGVDLHLPGFIPWTHKAHELVIHARDSGRDRDMHRRVFQAVFQEGRDIGRIDVLVALAQELEFDFKEVRAALDVDLHAPALEAIRSSTAAAGITSVPTVEAGSQRLEGFHNRDALGTFLHATDN